MSDPDAPSQGRKAFPLRLSPEVYDAIQRWAAEDLRSVNGQIEFLLRESLKKSGRLHPAGGAEPPPQ
jgi:hypothetical protein